MCGCGCTGQTRNLLYAGSRGLIYSVASGGASFYIQKHSTTSAVRNGACRADSVPLITRCRGFRAARTRPLLGSPPAQRHDGYLLSKAVVLGSHSADDPSAGSPSSGSPGARAAALPRAPRCLGTELHQNAAGRTRGKATSHDRPGFQFPADSASEHFPQTDRVHTGPLPRAARYVLAQRPTTVSPLLSVICKDFYCACSSLSHRLQMRPRMRLGVHTEPVDVMVSPVPLL